MTGKLWDEGREEEWDNAQRYEVGSEWLRRYYSSEHLFLRVTVHVIFDKTDSSIKGSIVVKRVNRSLLGAEG